jgi:hypothetical protein
MDYTQLEAGLTALAGNSRKNNVFIIAARNAILSEIGEPFVQFTTGWNTVTATVRPQTENLRRRLLNLSSTAIREAEEDLAEIVAGRTPASLTAAQVAELVPYAINATNQKIRTTSTALNQDHTSVTGTRMSILFTAEAQRRSDAQATVANGQSTMAAAVDPSVQQSVRNLIARYGATAYNTAAIQAATTGLEAAINAATTVFVRQPTAANAAALPAAALSLTEQKETARQALQSNYLALVPYQHRVLNYTIKQVLALIWTAANDRNTVLGPNQLPLVDNAQNTNAITTTIQERQRNLIAALVEFQTEYSIGHAACPHGTYNKIVETLNMAHPDVVVLHQDLSLTVTNEADRYIRGTVLPRVFAAQPNQAAIFAAFDAAIPTNAQQTLLDNFKGVMRQALRGELPGLESIYTTLKTRLSPMPFTAGQYTEERVLNTLIPNWLDNSYEYSGASLPRPRTFPIPLQSAEDLQRIRLAQLQAAQLQLQTAMAGITAAYQQAEARATTATQALTAAQASITQLASSNAQLQTAVTGINAAYQQAESRAGATNLQAATLERQKLTA